LILFSRSARFLPQLLRYFGRINSALLPPRSLISGVVRFPMMRPAKGNGEFIAYLQP
jgi:hypothetical protein